MKKIILIISIVCVFGCGNSENKRSIDYSDDEYKNNSETNSLNSVIETKDEPSNILYMEQENGVKYVWIEVNGIKLRFIFDTGASNICISSSEASVLYRQGTLSEEDFIGLENFQDATGRISQGAKVILRTVKVGDNLLENVEATVIDNENAPLLLGQSALERFGSIQIDNDNNRIIFK